MVFGKRKILGGNLLRVLFPTVTGRNPGLGIFTLESCLEFENRFTNFSEFCLRLILFSSSTPKNVGWATSLQNILITQSEKGKENKEFGGKKL